jgi:hypothetical protein
MNKNGSIKIGMLAIVGAVVVGAVTLVMMYVGYNNKEVELRQQAEAQEQANEVYYDKVWKILAQKAQLTEKYPEDFKEIFVNLMDARYGADKGDNPAFKWIQEQNPNFTSEMYMNLADSISAERTGFARVQTKLVDIKREHDVLLNKIPSKFFLGGIEELEIRVVTSTKTDATFEIGKEDDIELFSK